MNTMNTHESIEDRVKAFGELAKRHYKVPENANFKLPDRTWPDKDIEKAPIWCTVDLRDGNQSLRKPMTVEEKLEIFNMQVQMGFKEIEVGFPAASEPEYQFVRKLIEENLIPEGVKIQVLIQCKDELIEKTRKSLEGAKNVIIHIYNSTSTQQRETVFNKSKDEIINIAEEGVDLVKKYFADFTGNFQLEYSPESFTGTEIEYAEEICKKVFDRWNGFGGKDIIFNLPATVENSTPDRYADKIEYMSRALKTHVEATKSRIKAIISVHAHNDRGTGVAATELAIKAGADRVEGVIGVPNGERSGNIDIGTVALNMFSHGVDPELDLSNIGEISERISGIIKIPIHPRYPYAGELVHTAFSGSHQDAISKGLTKQEKRKATGDEVWDIPYLPINPEHIGLEYRPIQINSQSGKGGATFILNDIGYKIPKEMQKSIGNKVQEVTDKTN
ncbi:MAG: 2-isopropylmalate synthase, partial [Candidatus Gracilibacteria bacterium]|nr:2-isopropylmalate synthase [Candidatus Gracilibacteria bacterium]